MKALLIGFTAMATLFVGGQDDDVKKDQAKLKGAWKILSFETTQGAKDEFKDATLTFTDDGKVELLKTNETKKGTYKLNPASKPKQIELTGEENRTMKGIYQLEKDSLKIVTEHDPNGERPTEFAVKQGSGQALITLERLKK